MKQAPVKYVLFDVANTLLHKPLLWERVEEVLRSERYVLPMERVRYVHKLTSETLEFPDRTSETFYTRFNTRFLNNLGIVAEEALLNTLFTRCKNLPWDTFEDTSALTSIPVKIGILSNFNSGLRSLIEEKMKKVSFSDVFISEEMNIRKPDTEIFKKALAQLGIAAENVLYVGDSIRLDIAPALKLGMQVRLIDRDSYFSENKDRITSLHELLKIWEV
ncbi:HAD family hydrolase [Altibacter sp. HG106]|uniref:HAD family hydrolase n=1 Tax=Altibacter sp. HG106 TaxID=3023937 RepID=UPI00234FC4EB|nr:HAD family hydrolase [Altibacter sp. HG106]MDC7995700.1 HAD family hydrolase [Altibacter sp. HG106]